MSDYWHTHKEIPVHVIRYIKEVVTDSEIQVVRCNGTLMYKIDGYSFRKIFDLNREVMYRGDCITPSSEHDYNENSNYITMDGLAGFSITPSGWIVSLYSNKKSRQFLNIVRYFVNSGHKMICLTTEGEREDKLIQLYENKLGMKLIAYTEDDTFELQEAYGEEHIRDFIDFYGGAPRHLFMVKTDDEISEIKSFDILNKAIDYTNAYIK